MLLMLLKVRNSCADTVCYDSAPGERPPETLASKTLFGLTVADTLVRVMLPQLGVREPAALGDDNIIHIRCIATVRMEVAQSAGNYLLGSKRSGSLDRMQK